MYYQQNQHELHNGMNLVSGLINFSEEALRKVEKTQYDSNNIFVHKEANKSYSAHSSVYLKDINKEIATQQMIISTSTNANAVKEASTLLSQLQQNLTNYQSKKNDMFCIGIEKKSDARLVLDNLKTQGIFARDMDYKHNGQFVIICDKSQYNEVMTEAKKVNAHIYQEYDTDMGHTHVTKRNGDSADLRMDTPYKDLGRVRLSYGSLYETAVSRSLNSQLYASDLATYKTLRRYADAIFDADFRYEYGTLKYHPVAERQRIVTDVLLTGKNHKAIDNIFRTLNKKVDFSQALANLGLDEWNKTHTNTEQLHPILTGKNGTSAPTPIGSAKASKGIEFGATLSEMFLSKNTALRNDAVLNLWDARQKILAKAQNLHFDKKGNYEIGGLLNAIDAGKTLDRFGISEDEAIVLCATQDLGKSSFNEVMSGASGVAMFMLRESDLEDNQKLLEDIGTARDIIEQGKNVKDVGVHAVNALRREKGDKGSGSGSLKPLSGKEKNKANQRLNKRQNRLNLVNKKAERRFLLREKGNRTILGRGVGSIRKIKEFALKNTIGKKLGDTLVPRLARNMYKRISNTKFAKAMGKTKFGRATSTFGKKVSNSKIGKAFKNFFGKLGNASIFSVFKSLGSFTQNAKKYAIVGGVLLVIIPETILPITLSTINGLFDTTKASMAYRLLEATEDAETEWVKKMENPTIISKNLPYLVYGRDYQDFVSYISSKEEFFNHQNILYANPYNFMPKDISNVLRQFSRKDNDKIVTNVTIKPYGDSSRTSNSKEIIAMADVMYNSDLEGASDENILTKNKVLASFKSLGSTIVSEFKNKVDSIEFTFKYLGTMIKRCFKEDDRSEEDIVESLIVQSFYDDKTNEYKFPRYTALLNYIEGLFNASHQATYELDLVAYPIGITPQNKEYKYVLPSEIANDSQVAEHLTNATTHFYQCDGCAEYDKFKYRLVGNKYVLCLEDNADLFHDMTEYIKVNDDETPCNVNSGSLSTVWETIKTHEDCWEKATISASSGVNDYVSKIAPIQVLTNSEKEIICDATSKWYKSGSLDCEGKGGDGKNHEYTIYDVTSFKNGEDGVYLTATGYRTYVEEKKETVDNSHTETFFDYSSKWTITEDEYEDMEAERDGWTWIYGNVYSNGGDVYLVQFYSPNIYLVPQESEWVEDKKEIKIEIDHVETKDFDIHIKWECQGHKAKYCAGHLLINSTGYVYSASKEQLSENPEIDGKMKDIDYSTFSKAVQSGLNLKSESVDGTNIKGANIGNNKKIIWSTESEVDSSNVDIKKAQDIFDIDSQILYPQSIFPYYDYRNYEGWTQMNMELALLKMKTSWKDLYKFDIADNVGCPSLSAVDIRKIKESIGFDGLNEARKTVVDNALQSVGNGYYDSTSTHLYAKDGDNGTNSADYLSWAMDLTHPTGYTSIKDMYRNGLIRNRSNYGLQAGDFVFDTKDVGRGDDFLDCAVSGVIYIGTTQKEIKIYNDVEAPIITKQGKNDIHGTSIPEGINLYVGVSKVGQKGNIYLFCNVLNLAERGVYTGDDSDDSADYFFSVDGYTIESGSISAYHTKWEKARYFYSYDGTYRSKMN